MMWLLALAAFADEPEETVLDSTDFAFCHQNGDFERNELFCPLLEHVPEDRCPGLRAFCAAPDEAPAGCNRGSRSTTRGGGNNTPAGAPDEPPEPFREAPGCDCDTQVPDLGITSLLGWVFAFLVVFLIAGIVITLLRYFGLRPDEPKAPARVVRIAPEDVQSFAEAVVDVPDLPSKDLLAAARAAVDAGDFGQAAVLARGSVLRSLGERRILRLHRARTDREYLGQAPVHREDLGQVFDAAEQHRWGRVPLDRPGVMRAIDAAARLLALSCLLFFVAGARAADRYDPDGDVAVQRVFQRYGYSVGYRMRSFETLAEDEEVDVLFLDTSGVEPTEEDWASIREWVETGHVLWVIGTGAPFEELGELEAVSGPFVLAPELTLADVPEPVFADASVSGFTGGRPWVEGLVASPVVAAELGEGVVFAVSEPTFAWNGSFVVPANERFMGEVLARGLAAGWPMSAPIHIEMATRSAVGGGGGGGGNSPTESLANLRLLPLVIQVLILWAVWVAWRGWPFAPLVDDRKRDRLDFGEHIDALALQYRSARGGRLVASRYAAYHVERVRRAGLVLAFRRAGHTSKEAAAWADRIVELADNPEGESSQADFEMMEMLWKVTRPR